MSQSLPQEIGVLPEPARRGLAARRPSAAEGLLRSILILLVAYVVLVAGFMGWIARSAATDEAPSPPAASAAAASTQSRSIDVTLGDMFIKPSSVSVPAGTPLVFHVTNTGAITHNFTLGTGGATPDIAPGGSAELKAGPFSSSLQAYCSIPGHKQAGMVMTINVTSAASSPTAGPSPSARDATIDTSATPGPSWHAFDPNLDPAPGGGVHDVTFHMTDVTREVGPGVTQQAWTFNGQVPGPVLRGHVGDIFNVTVINDTSMTHSIDFHASQVAPNIAMAAIAPGASLVYQFRADYSGIWMYHCGTAPALQHIANGMFGAVVIDPPNLAPVAHEYVMIQSELYLGPNGALGDYAKMLADTPDAVVFNGYYNQYKYAPIAVQPGQRIRIWVLDAGPSDISSFHIVGTIFDTVFKEGHYELQPGNATHGGSQALDLDPAQGGFVELTFAQPGIYTMVSHKFADATRGALGTFQVGGATGTMSH